MSEQTRRTNPLLLLVMILLCLCAGFFFRRSSYDPEYSSQQTKDTKTSAVDSANSSNRSSSDSSKKASAKATATATPKATASPAVIKTPVSVQPETASASRDISAEAASGVWTSNGSTWSFMVDGQPYTGWLVDTDGKQYFFDSDGIMQTGWIDDDGHRYYMDQDGIMQTGTVNIDGKDYTFLEDGTLSDNSKKKSSK
ncbi:N-acetylmuramoyl-L-alanine amidase family protein [Blautia sp. MSJ-19]|uniref:N-acetylmuramoyl-L-alanine amidase family protein n=1 Tax=Blautia sp. MSJ-19 TaxID=2841517 RepID=UPI001C0ED510|nr:cell wall-binding protein [Blautia sp. MSJ-19]MBU5482329.1 cell wall-binding protein [Blautia sp. MSJ-19]